jgi:uncharacterized protein (DUF342 family)|tara:strand:+ start:155 stop:400 length:246 start_codon:yes stop_codon:yes gene_type:complete
MARTALATQSERKNLEAHVDLCAERYNRLEQRLLALETAMQEMKEMILAESQKSTKIVIGAAATVVGGLLSTLVAVILVLV